MMDCDALAILTFADEGKFGQFMGKVTETEAARKIKEDEEAFLDGERMRVFVIGESLGSFN